MRLSELIDIKRRTKFRLRLELTLIPFILLVFQVLRTKTSLLEVVITLIAILWVVAGAKELKNRHEPFTRRQKHALFGLDTFICGVFLVALLIAGINERTPLLWIMCGLGAVVILFAVFKDYDQLYRDGNSA